jgi:hypothetical protein
MNGCDLFAASASQKPAVEKAGIILAITKTARMQVTNSAAIRSLTRGRSGFKLSSALWSLAWCCSQRLQHLDAPSFGLPDTWSCSLSAGCLQLSSPPCQCVQLQNPTGNESSEYPPALKVSRPLLLSSPSSCSDRDRSYCPLPRFRPRQSRVCCLRIFRRLIGG